MDVVVILRYMYWRRGRGDQAQGGTVMIVRAVMVHTPTKVKVDIFSLSVR